VIPSEMIGIAGFLLLFALILLGSPIWIALIFVGFIGLVTVKGFSPAMATLSTTPYHQVASFAFVVVPLFVLMGEFATHGGIADEMYAAARSWVGRVHGGLAMATTLGCAFFAVVTGSAVATSATFTKVALPEMRRYNYDDRLSLATIACSGTIAGLIPPSGVMVYFCILTGTSLGQLMIGGFIPGFLSAFIYMAMIHIWSRLNPRLGPPIPLPASWKEKALASRWLLPVAAIMVVMLGGIYLGVFSPSEAAAIGAFCTFMAALIRKSLSLERVKASLIGTAITTAMVILIVVGAMIFGRFLIVSGFTTMIFDLFLGLPGPPIVSVILILIAYIAGGCIMPPIAMLAITLPVVFPLLTEGFGYNGVWVGIISIKILEIGGITPPVGLSLFAVKAAGGEAVDLGTIIRGVFPFFLMDILTLAILVALPQISLWLPSKMFQ
jgi:C4-dicarboxylate transporter DctM subunit